MLNAESLVGRQIDQFRLDKYLARGAMGMVYKAFDTILVRTVALKVIPKALEDGLSPQELAAREEARKRLIQEAKAAGRLNHPNIVTIHNYGETAEFEYICMEYVTGKTLSEVLRERRVLEVDEAIHIVEQILMALDVSAREHIVHRDIKPSNVMITPENRAKVMDFGIAKLPSLAMTTTGTVLGTPYYMSPEQISGQKVDIRSDLFSVGAVLYEMMTGERPFEAENTATLAYKIVQVEPLPAKVLNVHIPEAVGKVITRALAKDPTQRYQSPAEMIQDLKAIRGKPSEMDGEATVIGKVVDLEETVHVVMAQTGAEKIEEPRTQPPQRFQADDGLSGEATVMASSQPAMEKQAAPEVRITGSTRAVPMEKPSEEATVLASSQSGMEKEPAGEETVMAPSRPPVEKSAAAESLVFSVATVDAPSAARLSDAGPEIAPFTVPPPPPGLEAEKPDRPEKAKGPEPAAGSEPPKAKAAKKTVEDKEAAAPGAVPPRAGKATAPAAAKAEPAKSGGGPKTAVIVVLLLLAAAAGGYYFFKGPSGPATPPGTTVAVAPSTTLPKAPATTQPTVDRAQTAAKVDALVAEAKNQWTANPRAAQEALQEALKLDPNHYDAVFQYGRFLTQWRDYTAAIQQYETALRINSRSAEAYFNLGFVYMTQGNLDSAIFNFESCRALNPSFQDEVLTNLGIVYLKKNDTAQAQNFFKQALEANPNNTVARNYAASTASTTVPGTVPPPVTTMPPVTTAAPAATVPPAPTTEPPATTASAPSAADPTAQASRQASVTPAEPPKVPAAPGVQPALSADALVEKAKPLVQSDPAAAQKLLEDAVNSDPSHFDANYQLARVLTQKKEYPTAIQYYLIAQRIKSRAPEIYFNLGYIYMNQGELEMARMNYESCLALSPPYRDEVLTNLGIVQLKKKNIDEARAMFRQALEFNPKNSLARSQLNKLEAPAGKPGQKRLR